MNSLKPGARPIDKWIQRIDLELATNELHRAQHPDPTIPDLVAAGRLPETALTWRKEKP